MFSRIATWYGNYIARTRLPVAPWTRRLARTNPTDLGKLILVLTLINIVHTEQTRFLRSRLRESEARREQAESAWTMLIKARPN